MQKQVDAGLFRYVASRRSYKNGGFNSFIAPKIGFAETGGSQYRSETLTDAEFGAKFNGRLGGVPFRTNFATLL